MVGFFRNREFVTIGLCLTSALLAMLMPGHALAHVSEQGLVLLLPTGLYIISGTGAVIITLLVITLMPASLISKLFTGHATHIKLYIRFENPLSLVATGILWVLILIGFYGPHDPLENLLPLIIWTLWWQGYLLLQAVFGNLWHWINPWTGIYALLRGSVDRTGFMQLPTRLGVAPGIFAFICFAMFMLVDIAPDNPERLAMVVAVYWLYTLAGMVIFGAKDWLERAECFTMLLSKFAQLSAFCIKNGKLHIGFPGWRLVDSRLPTLSEGLFIVIILATGSFDGLNETFWWLAKIGINPLEFPGRSEVIWPNSLGLLASYLFLPLCLAFCVFVGLKLAKLSSSLSDTFAVFAITLLPIAVGYHFSHYLTAFMVNIQYLVAALSDPLDNGADYLHLGVFYVTSGFLNSHNTVKAIWLLQASFVVAGHMIAVLVSHGLALKIFGNSAKATTAQMPLALFMIAYTIFGLWLLASPRGL